MRAMWLGELVAVQGEENAAAHPAEIVRRRLLGECRTRWCSSYVDATAEHVDL